jgi:hypothetical protein
VSIFHAASLTGGLIESIVSLVGAVVAAAEERDGMDILIKSDATTVSESGLTIRSFEIDANGVEVIVMLVSGSKVMPDRVTVLVCNASHKAFRKMGRDFANLDAALAAYRGKHAQAALQVVAAIVNAPAASVAA